VFEVGGTRDAYPFPGLAQAFHAATETIEARAARCFHFVARGVYLGAYGAVFTPFEEVPGMSNELSRRTFVKASAAGAAAALSLAAPRAVGANERIRAAFIGVANRGGQLIEAAQPHADLEIAAVCDVHAPTRARWAEKLGVPAYNDFREILDRKDIDAIFIATPDHWHALQTILACEAGKDVYVEKPLAATIVEGRHMINAARRTGRIVQVGIHRRSAEVYHKLHETVRGGAVGKVTAAHCFRINNMWPSGIGKFPASTPPDDLDWDLWLGPRAARPYQENITPYKFRWWQDYSSQTGNWGVHFFDVVRWVLDEEAPVAISAHGGKFAIDDDRTIPDTLQAIFEFASGRLLFFGQYEASGAPMIPGDIDLRGTQGIIYAKENGFKVLAESRGQFQAKDAPRAEPQEFTATDSNHSLTARHIRNFLDCVKSRALPVADVEIGHHSTNFSHLANIAWHTQSRIHWDPVAERITNNDAANELLHYEYRAPWKLG